MRSNNQVETLPVGAIEADAELREKAVKLVAGYWQIPVEYVRRMRHVKFDEAINLVMLGLKERSENGY